MTTANITYIEARGPLASCCESLTLAYWTRDNFHAENAQNYLLWALSGSSIAPREHLVDLIASAIDDTIDIDWTSECAAKHIVDVLLEGVIPSIKEPDPSPEASQCA